MKQIQQYNTQYENAIQIINKLKIKINNYAISFNNNLYFSYSSTLGLYFSVVYCFDASFLIKEWRAGCLVENIGERGALMGHFG